MRLAPIITVVTASLLLALPAGAQHSSIGWGLYDAEGFRPAFTRHDLTVIARVLKLKPEEQSALNALYAGYETNLKARAAEIKAFVAATADEAEILQDSDVLNRARKRLSEWDDEAERLKKSFLDDLRSLLTRDQDARWPILERELRRIRRIGAGRLSGESVDVARLVESVLEADGGSTLPPGIAELEERYAEELDHAIVDRDRVLDREKEFSELSASSPTAAKALYDEAVKARDSVRAVNRNFVRLIGAELSAKARAALEDRFHRESYPRLYDQKTRAQSFIRAATELTTLTAEQAHDLGVIAAKHRDRLHAWIRDAAAFEDEQDTAPPISLQVRLGTIPADRENFDGAARLGPDHPLTRLRRQRYEFEKAFREQAERVLTAEQRAEVQVERAAQATLGDWSPTGL